MDILATVEHTTIFWIGTILYGAVAVLFVVLGSLANLTGNKQDKIGGLFLLGISILFFFVSFNVYTTGPRVTYKAKVTDFNVVYDKGYEVTDQEGEIYTLKKKED